MSGKPVELTLKPLVGAELLLPKRAPSGELHLRSLSFESESRFIPVVASTLSRPGSFAHHSLRQSESTRKNSTLSQ